MIQAIMQYRFVSDTAREQYKGVFEPTRQDDAGIDLRVTEGVTIAPGQTIRCGLGVAINILDPSMACLVLPRSGMGSEGLVIGNLVGLIDCGYQNELTATLWNRHVDKTFVLEPGDRVAQLVRIELYRCKNVEVAEFAPSERGLAGYGSSGIK